MAVAGPRNSLTEDDAPGVGPSFSLTEDDAPGPGPSISHIMKKLLMPLL